jgi:hypothetical protein
VVKLVICELHGAGKHPALIYVAFSLAANKVALAAMHSKRIEIGEVLVNLTGLVAQVAAKVIALHVHEKLVVI